LEVGKRTIDLFLHTSQNPERTAARQCGFHLLPEGRGLTPQLVSWLLNFAKARTSRLTSERYHMCVCGVNAQSDSSFQRGFNSLLHYMVHRIPGLCTIFTDPFIAFGMMRTIGRKKEEATLLTSHLLAILLTPFRDGFTRPTWRKVLILLEGTLLARGRRTVTAALRLMDLHQLTRFNVFHHVLSRARWSPLQMSRVLFLLLVHAFVPAGSPNAPKLCFRIVKVNSLVAQVGVAASASDGTRPSSSQIVRTRIFAIPSGWCQISSVRTSPTAWAMSCRRSTNAFFVKNGLLILGRRMALF
jgi:hypothetical protein